MAIKGGFTAHSVKTMLVGEGGDKVDGLRRDPACVGLYLWVRGNGKYRAYQYRYAKDSREYVLSLGSIGKTTLEAARAKAREHTAVLQSGGNPGLKASVTVPTVQNTFKKDTLACWRKLKGKPGAEGAWDEDHARQWLASVENHVWPHIGERDTASVTTAEIVTLLGGDDENGFWYQKTETAQRVLGRIQAIIEHAIDSDDHNRFPGKTNVADSVRRRMPQNVRAKEVSHPALDWREGQFLYQTLEDVQTLNRWPYRWPTRLRVTPAQKLAALALRFCMLVCSRRTEEVIAIRWEEIDGDGDVWHIPGDRVKSENPCDVPLTKEALDVLALVPGARTGYVFKGRRGAWIKQVFVEFSGHAHHDCMQSLLRDKLKLTDKAGLGLHVHGVRSMFASWGKKHARNPAEADAVKIAIDHVLGTKVDRVYDREILIEERRVMAERWAAFLLNRPVAMKLAA